MGENIKIMILATSSSKKIGAVLDVIQSQNNYLGNIH